MLFRFGPVLSPEGGEGGGGGGDPEMVAFQHGDQTINVPRAAMKGWLPEKEINERFIPKPAHNDQMARLRREADGYKDRKLPDELMQDPEFKAKAIQVWGLDPNAGSEQLRTAVDRKQSEIFEREVKPRDAKLAAAHETIDSLLVKDLHRQIVQDAIEAGVDKKYCKPASKGGRPLIVAMLEDNFDFDPEHGEWFAKGSGGQSFAFSQTGGDQPYMTVAEYIATWAQDGGKDFRPSERQSGAEAGAGQRSGGDRQKAPGVVGTELRVTREQYSDVAYMRKANERAAKEGLTIVPV